MTSQMKPKTIRSNVPRARCRTTSIGRIRHRPANNPQTISDISAAPAPMDELLKRAAATARRSRSKNTELTYNSALRTFSKFAAAQGLTVFPASAHTVAAFLQCRIEAGVSPMSLTVALAALRSAHCEGKQPDPTNNPHVRAIAQGYQRIRAAQGKRPKQTRGMSEADFAAIVAVAKSNGDDMLAVRDIAIISMLREGLLRRSECAALHVRDFSCGADGSGRLQITRSKTDQEGEGRTLFLGENATSAVVKWLDRAPADGDAPLFRRIVHNGRVHSSGLAGSSINRIVRSRGEDAGIAGLSGHSGRVGMAQSLIAFGASIGEVAIAGRWKSVEHVIYYASRQEASRSAIAKYRQNQG